MSRDLPFPESKREVVAQAVDYGSSLSRWNYEKLNSTVRDYTKRFEKTEMDLVDWVETKLGPIEEGKTFFEETVSKNLRLGRFLTLVVGDKIRQSVFEMINYVNKFPGLAMAVALIELQCYKMEAKKNWPLLIVPRIVAKTEIVERSIIQVTVNQGQQPVIDIKQEKGKAEEKGKKKVNLTEEAFWELLKERSPENYETACKLIEEYKKMDGIDVVPTESAMLVKLDIQDTGKQISLFFINWRGSLVSWYRTIGRQLASAGLDSKLAELFGKELRGIMKMPKDRVELSQPLAKVDLKSFKSAVNNFIKKVQTAELTS